jgi:branched-chain amino acid transport system ATP-binding protein
MTHAKENKGAVLNLFQAVSGYGTNPVLHKVSLDVGRNEIVTLLGSNGAGKSTTLLTISGTLPLRSGEIRWQGEPARFRSADEAMRSGISLCPEGRRIFPRLTVLENLQIGAYLCSPSQVRETLEQVYGHFPILFERREQLAGTLSGGEQQMLAIGRSLMGRPKFLMLDEPSLGLAPLIVERIFGILTEINRQGLPILLVEQNARQALAIAHRGYVLVTGKIVMEGSGQELLRSDVVRRAYLGGA